MYNFVAFISFLFFAGIALIAAITGKTNFLFSALAFLTFPVIFLIFRKINSKITSNFQSETEKLEEKINLLSQDISEKKKIYNQLPEKCSRIESLFEVSHELVELYNFQEILDFLVKSLENMFPSANNIMLFILHKNSLSLSLSFKKEDCVIKEKTGDIIEKWLLRHNQSLIIEDLLRDFRFDYNKVAAFKERKIRSLIASPLSLGDSILGTVRIESKSPLSFSFDDSRLLRDTCDLAAVVLERAALFAKAEELAIRDSLTSLFMKDHFFKRAQEELKRTKYKNGSLGIIMVDIDSFKNINDTYGHIIGDIVLKRTAKILTDTVGAAGDIIARFGGEEFIIALIECDKKRLTGLCESICANIAHAKISFRRKSINFTVSVGAVLYPQDGTELMDLVKKADQYLYKAKKEGKNKCCFTGQ